MAKKDRLKILKEEAIIPEAYLVGLFWSDPELYAIYGSDKLNYETFLNKVWSFYFTLGRHMHDKEIVIFDDITVMRFVQELKLEDRFEKYGEFETIHDIMHEVEDKKENIDAYYNGVKKYRLLVGLMQTIGEQVLDVDGKYDYHNLSRDAIHTYWMDKVLKVGMDGDTTFREAFLLDDLEGFVEEMNDKPDTGMPFYESKRMTEICAGQANGCLYINGGFGGKGKTSMSFNKVIMSHIKMRQKLVVIANEQDIGDFKKMLLITAMGILKVKFHRKRMNEGNFTSEERVNLQKAIDLVRQWIGTDDPKSEKLVAFVFLEEYTMSWVKKVLNFYHHRGYRSVMIDTGKPSDDANGMARWESFANDFKDLYKMVKPQNLNMFCWVNVQLADHALTQRFLNENALGESKKIKNEATTVFLGRHIWEDEFAGGKFEVIVKKYVSKKNRMGGDPSFSNDATEKEIELSRYEQTYLTESRRVERKDSEYDILEFKLKQLDQYGNQNQFYFLFTSKNRRGQDNTTGLEVLVMKPNFNNNSWVEIGWTTIHKDFGI